LPLLLCDPTQMAVSVLIKALIGDKAGFSDDPMLAHGNHCEKFDVQIDGHRDQIWIALAFHDLFGGDGLALQEKDGRSLFVQDQLGAFRFPFWLCSSALKILVFAGWLVDPR